GVDDRGVEPHVGMAAAAALRLAVAGEIDHDRAHDVSRVDEEMGPILDLELAQAHEPQVALMHERGRVEQCNLGAAREPGSGKLAQLLVGHGAQAIDGASLAVSCSFKQRSEIARRGHRPRPICWCHYRTAVSRLWLSASGDGSSSGMATQGREWPDAQPWPATV